MSDFIAPIRERRSDLLRSIEQVRTFADSLDQPAAVERLERIARRLGDDKLVVVICGEFKRGKSTLGNALLGGAPLFPVDVAVTTSVVTTISYAPEERIRVMRTQAGQELIEDISRDQIGDYVTEQRNRDNWRGVRLLAIETDNQTLRDGLVLVDTPGVGGINSRHTDVTNAFIPHADAVLFVCDAQAPLNVEELAFLERIGEHCRHFIHVVTKIDLVPEYVHIVEENRRKLAKVLRCPADEIVIVPVSSQAKLDYLVSHDREDLELSNFEALEREIGSLLGERKGRILLTRALVDLRRVTQELQEPLGVEYWSLQGRAQADLNALEDQFESATERYQAFLADDARWRSDLSDEFGHLRRSLSEDVAQGFAEVRRKANVYLTADTALANPESIAGLLEGDVDALVTRINTKLSAHAAAVQQRVEKKSGLQLPRMSVAAIDIGLPDTMLTRAAEELRTQNVTWWGVALEVTREAKYAKDTGTVLASVFGAISGGVVGTLFGGIAGTPAAVLGAQLGAILANVAGLTAAARAAFTKAKHDAKESAKQRIGERMTQYLDTCHSRSTAEFDRSFGSVERSIRDVLEQNIAREKDQHASLLKSVRKARALSLRDVGGRLDALRSQLGSMTGFGVQIERIASTVGMEFTPVPAPQARLTPRSLRAALRLSSGSEGPSGGASVGG